MAAPRERGHHLFPAPDRVEVASARPVQALRPVVAQDLITAANVATAWTQTDAAGEAIESYSFDRDFDPVPR